MRVSYFLIYDVVAANGRFTVESRYFEQLGTEHCGISNNLIKVIYYI